MSKIVNLRQARKRRDRAAKKAEADANVARFGQTKTDRDQTDREASLTKRRLDGHKRDED